MKWLGEKHDSLEDIIEKRLDILFVGINPSFVSVEEGHYHRGILGKRFWSTIIRAKILKPAAGYYPDEFMLDQKLGITDIVKRPGRRMESLIPEDFREGRKRLFDKIIEYKPKIVCAIYKAVFEHLFSKRFTNVHGLLDNYKIGLSKMFILAPFFYPREERQQTAEELHRLQTELRKPRKGKKRKKKPA